MGFKRGKRADMTPKERELARIYDRIRRQSWDFGWSAYGRGVNRALNAVADNEKITVK